MMMEKKNVVLITVVSVGEVVEEKNQEVNDHLYSEKISTNVFIIIIISESLSSPIPRVSRLSKNKAKTQEQIFTCWFFIVLVIAFLQSTQLEQNNQHL